jgi:hypothetical protein
MSERQHQPCTVPRTCSSCGASIFWVETTNGKRMPVDCSPTTDGKYVLRHRKSEDKLYADVYQGEEVHHGRLRYTCHFGTCPNADQHRSSR